jgi:hypothetical protein
MYAIANPHEPRTAGLLADTPLPLLIALGVVTAVAGALATFDVLPLAVAHALGAGGAQGGLLATGVAWADAPRARRDRDAVIAAVLVGAGALGAALLPFGIAAYTLAPIWLWRRRALLPRFGLTRPPARLVAVGVAIGTLLGAHLLVTASFTRAYAVHVPTFTRLGPWLAYDAGANVLTAEAFFRGGLFDRAQRRWPFTAAAALATVACLARYLADPLLPRSVEMTAGAIFYLTLLSVANCWLYSRSGSIVPGMAAGIAFFVAYRLLHAAP